MPLEVVGAGWGRTGTTSTKLALDRLGYRTHHMGEVFAHLEQAVLFERAADEPGFDWEQIYRDYTATVDWPGCTFWRELTAAYPEAKVLLNVREPEGWFESWSATVYEPVVNGWSDDPTGDWNHMVQRVIVQGSLGGEPHDRDRVIAAYQQHIADVRATIPANRLLVYRVDDGWAPLCEFLDRSVLDEPFPHANARSTWSESSDS